MIHELIKNININFIFLFHLTRKHHRHWFKIKYGSLEVYFRTIYDSLEKGDNMKIILKLFFLQS